MKGAGTVEKHRGKWVARFRFRDAGTGKWREVRRVARTKAEATDLLDEIRARYGTTGGHTKVFSRLTFGELCEHYLEHYACAPVYAEGKKIGGLRSARAVRGYVAILREHFGERQVASLTYHDLMSFRREILSRPTHRKKPRSIANANRIMAALRSMMRIAVRERWITVSPFDQGPPLVRLTDEAPRERVMTDDEEKRLLEVCAAPERAHIALLIELGVGTGARLGELLAVDWRDVDFAQREVTIVGFRDEGDRIHANKTMKERVVPMSDRVHRILREWWIKSGRPQSGRVLPIREVKTAWRTACRLAKVEDLQFRDLRTTASTRMIRAGVPLAEVAKMLGHAGTTVTYRHYLISTREARKDAAEKMSAKRRRTKIKSSPA